MNGKATRRGVLVTVLVAWWAAPAVSPSPAVAAATTLPTFGRPVVSGVAGLGYEQDIRIDSQGRIYTSVPDGAPGNSFLWRSLDGGKTFKWVPATEPLTGKVPEACVGGGGDTELTVDPSGNLYFNDLTLANFDVGMSPDHGTTFPAANSSCISVPSALVDRQWSAFDATPPAGTGSGSNGNLYLTYDGVGTSPVVCPNSTTVTVNNQLLLSRSPDVTGLGTGLTFAAPALVTAPCAEGIMGNVEVSPVSHNVFIPHDDTFFQQVSVAKCTPVSFVVAPSGLSCSDTLISSFPTAITGANFPSLAIDKAGKLYAVWEEAPCGPCGYDPVSNSYTGTVTGDTLLYMSTSSNDGASWSAPVALGTAGLHNNVFAWVTAGDSGRIDIAWYGTSAVAPCCNGPDSVTGDWGLYLMQSLNGGASFTAPVLASEHFVHRGSFHTLLGGQTGDRVLGDYLQMRMGPNGEANITYGDSNNQAEALQASQAMFVRQVGGSSLLASVSKVSGGPPATNGVTDVACDATLDTAGSTSASMPHLDVLASTVSQPDSTHYRVTMTVKDLTSLTPAAGATDPFPDLVWLTQWHVPSKTDTFGGHVDFVYMESNAGSAPTFWTGDSGDVGPVNTGNGSFTYPGVTQLTTATYAAKAPGTITITVPIADVSDVAPLSTTLYSVTASTMTLPVSAETGYQGSGLGGQLFNLIDVAPPYDFVPGTAAAKLSVRTACP